MANDLLEQTTLLLRKMQDGDAGAADELFSAVYDQLRALARRVVGSSSRDQTLQPTAVVHEMWVRLGRNQELRVESRQHFMRVAAKAIRAVIVDHARRRGSQKRGRGAAAIDLEAHQPAVDEPDGVDALAVSDALDRLRAQDERLADVVELRFFGGLTNDEAAEVLGLTARQVQHAWKLARGWLLREMEKGERA